MLLRWRKPCTSFAPCEGWDPTTYILVPQAWPGATISRTLRGLYVWSWHSRRNLRRSMLGTRSWLSGPLPQLLQRIARRAYAILVPQPFRHALRSTREFRLFENRPYFARHPHRLVIPALDHACHLESPHAARI